VQERKGNTKDEKSERDGLATTKETAKTTGKTDPSKDKQKDSGNASRQSSTDLFTVPV